MPYTIPTHPQPELGLRLSSLAAWIRGGALIGAVASLALWLGLLAAPSPWLEPFLGEHTRAQLALVQGPLTSAIRGRLALAWLPDLALTLGLLWHTWRLFGAYRHGDVFGPQPLHHLQRMGWLLVTLAVTQPLTRSLGSVAVTWDNPPGQRMLVVSLGTHDYALLLAALVWLALARVMAEAARVAQDHAQIV